MIFSIVALFLFFQVKATSDPYPSFFYNGSGFPFQNINGRWTCRQKTQEGNNHVWKKDEIMEKFNEMQYNRDSVKEELKYLYRLDLSNSVFQPSNLGWLVDKAMPNLAYIDVTGSPTAKGFLKELIAKNTSLSNLRMIKAETPYGDPRVGIAEHDPCDMDILTALPRMNFDYPLTRDTPSYSAQYKTPVAVIHVDIARTALASEAYKLYPYDVLPIENDAPVRAIEYLNRLEGTYTESFFSSEGAKVLVKIQR